MDVKKVLYLSYDGMTDPLGQSQVLPYLIGLHKKGYQFTLVSFEKPEKFKQARALIQQLCLENDIDWHPLMYTKKPPILSTTKDLMALKSKVRKLHKIKSFELVHCRSYITALAGLWMKKKWGVKFVFDMRGFWADERIDGGLWNLKNPAFKIVYRYFKKKEKQFLQNADYTISLTQRARAEMESWDPEKKFSPVEVIPCCVDLEHFNPGKIELSKIDQLKEELQIQPQQKVITYIGSIGTWYMLEEMADFFKVFLQQHEEAVFLFVTKDRKEEIEKVLRKKGIPQRAVRIRAGERNQMPLFIAASDYSIFFIKPTYSKKASSPTKQGEIMAMGIPVICNDHVGDTSAVVEECAAGVVTRDFSEKAYSEAIARLLRTDFDKAAIRQGATKYFSLENGIKKYSLVYEKIMK